MRVLVLASIVAACLAACTKEGAGPTDPAQAPPGSAPPSQVASAGPPAVEGQINWEAARKDLSKRPSDAPVTVQTAGQQGPVKVPMLLPSGIVQTQNDRPVPPVVTADGYFATYHLPKYDAIVNGSMVSRSAAGQKSQGDKETMKFTTGEASAQLAFSRYGADYLIEFECRQVDGGASCITEAEAKEFADSLFVAQTQ